MFELKKHSYTPEPTAREIARLLSDGKEKQGQRGLWYSTCPAHDDAGLYSLRLRDTVNGVQMQCREGCDHAHVRAYAYQRIAQIAIKNETKRKVVSIERKERIKRSIDGIWSNLSELVEVCLDWLTWKVREIEER